MERKDKKLILTVEEPTLQMPLLSQVDSKTAKFVNFAMEQTIKVMLVAISYISAYMITHFNLHPAPTITLLISASFMVFAGFAIYKGKPIKSKGMPSNASKTYTFNNGTIINAAARRRLSVAATKILCLIAMLYGATYGLGLLITSIKGFLAGL